MPYINTHTIIHVYNIIHACTYVVLYMTLYIPNYVHVHTIVQHVYIYIVYMEIIITRVLAASAADEGGGS